MLLKRASAPNALATAPCRARPGCKVSGQQWRTGSASTDAAGTVTYSFDETTNSATPSSYYTTTTTTTSSSSNNNSMVQSTVSATKLALLERVAGLDRGALASKFDKEEVERLVKVLEEAAGPAGAADPFGGSPAAVEGRWELIYTNKETFRASPFFLAFQDGLVQNQQLAEAIFAFTDAIPGATIRGAFQTISLLSGSLISEVDMEVWPGLRGTVVTSSRASIKNRSGATSASPSSPSSSSSLSSPAANSSSLELVVESTRVTGSTFSPFLDNVSVPVEQLVAAVRGGDSGATRASYTFTYVDANLRVTRAGDQLLLHRRVL